MPCLNIQCSRNTSARSCIATAVDGVAIIYVSWTSGQKSMEPIECPPSILKRTNYRPKNLFYTYADLAKHCIDVAAPKRHTGAQPPNLLDILVDLEAITIRSGASVRYGKYYPSSLSYCLGASRRTNWFYTDRLTGDLHSLVRSKRPVNLNWHADV